MILECPKCGKKAMEATDIGWICGNCGNHIRD